MQGEQEEAVTSPDDETFRPKDIRRKFGMSYRQLHHAEAKGAAGSDRSSDGGWRRYSFRQVFVLLLCREINQRFGTPLDSLKWLSQAMLEAPDDPFFVAYRKIKIHGFAVLLWTDLKTFFGLETDVDLAERFELGEYRSDDAEAYLLLKVNPVINRMLAATTKPEELHVRHEVYDQIRRGRHFLTAETLEEMQVLALLRDKTNHSVKVFLDSEGGIDRAEVERQETAGADLSALRDLDEFQKIELSVRDGAPRSIRRVISKKLEKNVDEKGRRLPIVVRLTDYDPSNTAAGKVKNARRRR